jgi:hypothetical protein
MKESELQALADELKKDCVEPKDGFYTIYVTSEDGAKAAAELLELEGSSPQEKETHAIRQQPIANV